MPYTPEDIAVFRAALTTDNTQAGGDLTDAAIAAGLEAVARARLQKSQDPRTITKETTLSLLARARTEPQNPYLAAISVISSCGARIEQDGFQRRPSSPVTYRQWEIEAVIRILQIFNAPAPDINI